MEGLSLNRTLQIPIKENNIFQMWDFLQRMYEFNTLEHDGEIDIIYDMLKSYLKEFPTMADSAIETVKTITELIRAINANRVEIEQHLEKTKKVAATVSDI